MQRSAKTKAAPKRTTPVKKQKTILSFFSKTTSAAKPSPFNKRSSANPQRTPPSAPTPSTSHSLDTTAPKSSEARPARSPLRRSNDSLLKRELFSDDVDAPSVRRVKRRKILLDEDFSDEETPMKPRANIFSGKPADDVCMPSVAVASSQRRRVSPAKPMPENVIDVDEPEDEYKPEDDDVLEDDDDPEDDNPEDDDEPLCKPGQSAPSDQLFDFTSMTCRDRTEPGAEPTIIDDATLELSKARKAARKKLSALDNMRGVGNEEGGWCEKHAWTVDIRDANRRRPDHPDYDKTTLYVPASELAEKSRGGKGSGLSPFQRQFWSIKKENYDVIVFFKKGKFYELYDVDADVGHKVLGLNFTKGGRVDMRCCGVPEQAFDKHCSRLIDNGFKVGRVEQTETANAAEKRKNGGGSNKSSVCERSLVRILTKGTLTDESLLRDHRARYVIAIAEREPDISLPDSDNSTVIDGEGQSQNGQSRVLGICYVDVASGSINVGDLHDDFRLSKTERLVTFLRPQEIVIDLSKSSARVSNIVKWASNKSGAELIDMGRKNGFPKMTAQWLATYLRDASSSPEHKKEYDRVRSYLLKFPLSCLAFGAMAAHLRSLIIDRETLSLGNYNLFSEQTETTKGTNPPLITSDLPLPSHRRLRMDAPTLQNLEILTSTVDESERGALVSFVDRAKTPSGRRLIRKWIAEPLVSSDEIEDRLRAIEDIHAIEDEDGGRTLDRILKQLKTRKDLERALPKLHQQATVNDSAVMFDDTNKRRVKDFILVLRSLEDSLSALDSLREAMELSAPKSRRLQYLCSDGGGTPHDATDKLNFFLGEAFELDRAEKEGEILPKKGAVPSYDQARDALDAVEAALDQELKKWQRILKDRSIKFYHRGKEPFQLEVKADTVKGRTPSEFEVVSESKVAKRFYTRHLKKLIRRQVEASEVYEEASSSVARDMMRQFDKEYSTWFAVSSVCAELDALIGLASASRDEGSGPMCRPTILPNDHSTPVLQTEQLRHPILAANSNSFVSNNVALGGEQDPEIMILTGPNAGGKSTLARQLALGVILAQLGCFVPAESFTLRPFEDIFVRMGASDDLARGRSTFMVEMEEVGNILNNANPYSLVIADEVGRGTSTHDGYAVAYAALDHIAKMNKSLTVFSTHYSHLGGDVVALGEKEGRLRASLYEMGAIVNEESKRITFLYKLQPGSSGDSRGIYCARVAGIPESIAAEAEKAAVAFDETLGARLATTKFSSLSKRLKLNNGAAIRLLQQEIN